MALGVGAAFVGIAAHHGHHTRTFDFAKGGAAFLLGDFAAAYEAPADFLAHGLYNFSTSEMMLSGTSPHRLSPALTFWRMSVEEAGNSGASSF